jgi:3-hydroxyacyl-[acyl-carrier-protein] dehydratase
LASLERAFAPDHPAAQGHFPGNPVIPGALLLSEVLLAIEADLGRRLECCKVRSVKFLRPVRPGDRIRIEYSGGVEPRLRITCSAEGHAVLAGEVWCDTAK